MSASFYKLGNGEGGGEERASSAGSTDAKWVSAGSGRAAGRGRSRARLGAIRVSIGGPAAAAQSHQDGALSGPGQRDGGVALSPESSHRGSDTTGVSERRGGGKKVGGEERKVPDSGESATPGSAPSLLGKQHPDDARGEAAGVEPLGGRVPGLVSRGTSSLQHRRAQGEHGGQVELGEEARGGLHPEPVKPQHLRRKAAPGVVPDAPLQQEQGGQPGGVMVVEIPPHTILQPPTDINVEVSSTMFLTFSLL